MSEDTHELDLGREAMIGFSARGAMMAFGFAGVVIFAHVLGAAGLGRFYIVLAAGKLLSQFSNGIGAAVKKRVSEAGTAPAAFLGAGLLAHLGFSAAVGISTLLLEPLLQRFFSVPNLAIGITAVVFGLGLFQICNAFYAGLGNPGFSSWADMARSVLTLGFQLGFLVAGWGAFGLVLGFAIAAVLSGLGVWMLTGIRPTIPSRRIVASSYEFARWSVPNDFLTSTYGRADVLLVGALVGNAAAGFYEAALRLTQPGAFFATSISSPLQVKTSGLSSRGLDVQEDLANALSYAGLLTIPILFGAAAMPDALMRTIFGSEFAAAGAALVGLAVFQVLSGFGASFGAMLTGSDRIDRELRVNTAVLAVHLPLAALGAWQFGLLGVVGATVLAEVLRLVFYEYLVERRFGDVVVPTPVLSQLVAGGVMGLSVFAIVEYAVSIRGWAWLVGVVAAGAAIYFGVLLVASAHFRHTLDSTLPIDYSR